MIEFKGNKSDIVHRPEQLDLCTYIYFGVMSETTVTVIINGEQITLLPFVKLNIYIISYELNIDDNVLFYGIEREEPIDAADLFSKRNPRGVVNNASNSFQTQNNTRPALAESTEGDNFTVNTTSSSPNNTPFYYTITSENSELLINNAEGLYIINNGVSQFDFSTNFIGLEEPEEVVITVYRDLARTDVVRIFSIIVKPFIVNVTVTENVIEEGNNTLVKFSGLVQGVEYYYRITPNGMFNINQKDFNPENTPIQGSILGNEIGEAELLIDTVINYDGDISYGNIKSFELLDRLPVVRPAFILAVEDGFIYGLANDLDLKLYRRTFDGVKSEAVTTIPIPNVGNQNNSNRFPFNIERSNNTLQTVNTGAYDAFEIDLNTNTVTKRINDVNNFRTHFLRYDIDFNQYYLSTLRGSFILNENFELVRQLTSSSTYSNAFSKEFIYVSNESGSSITRFEKIDIGNQITVSGFDVSGAFRDIVVYNNEYVIFISNGGGYVITDLDLNQLDFITDTNATLDLHLFENLLYVNSRNSWSVYDISQGVFNLIHTETAGVTNIGISANEQYVYVASLNSNEILIYEQVRDVEISPEPEFEDIKLEIYNDSRYRERIDDGNGDIRIINVPSEYTVTLDDNQIDEGESTTARVLTNEQDGTVYYYTINGVGIDSDDFVNGFKQKGTVTVTNGEATLQIDTVINKDAPDTFDDSSGNERHLTTVNNPVYNNQEGATFDGVDNYAFYEYNLRDLRNANSGVIRGVWQSNNDNNQVPFEISADVNGSVNDFFQITNTVKTNIGLNLNLQNNLGGGITLNIGDVLQNGEVYEIWWQFDIIAQTLNVRRYSNGVSTDYSFDTGAIRFRNGLGVISLGANTDFQGNFGAFSPTTINEVRIWDRILDAQTLDDILQRRSFVNQNEGSEYATYLLEPINESLSETATIRFYSDSRRTIQIGETVTLDIIDKSPTEESSLPEGEYTGSSFIVVNEDSSPENIHLNEEGTKLYYIGTDTDNVYEYDLSIPFDISTTQYTGKSFYLGNEDLTPRGIHLDREGTKMYMVGSDTDSVYQYELETPFDINSMVYTGKVFFIGEQDSFPESIYMDIEGTKMYILGNNTDSVYEYDLTIPFDISSAQYNGKFISLLAQDSITRCIHFNIEGTKMFMVGSETDSIYEYILDKQFDINTARFTGNSIFIGNEDVTPRGIHVNESESKLFMVGSNTDAIYEYSIPDNNS